MVQMALNTVWQALISLKFWVGPLVALLFGTLLFVLLLSLLDRERARAYWVSLSGTALGARRWLWPVLGLAAGCLLLNISARSLDARLGQQLSTHTRLSADPDGQPTTQLSPTVVLVEPHTYSRTLTLPRGLYTRLEVAGGWEALTPYLINDAGRASSVQDIREGFTVQGKNLYYTREVTMLQEHLLALDTSQVEAKLNFGGNASVYKAQFAADYSFTNPQDHPITARFSFPLPVGSGTLSSFRMKVNGQEYRAADLTGGSEWEGEVPARATVKVNVSYQHQGSRGWSYQLSQRREPIRSFALKVTADRQAGFGRYSLYPTRITGGLFGQKTLEWNLQDIITAQNVAVVFSQGSVRELLSKVHLFMPLSLLLLAILSVYYSVNYHVSLLPKNLAWGVLALSLGYTLGGVLTAYLPPTLAEVLGVLAAVILALRCLGREYLVPVVLVAIAPLAFLSGGHAGLLLSLLAVGLLWLFMPQRPKPEYVPLSGGKQG